MRNITKTLSVLLALSLFLPCFACGGEGEYYDDSFREAARVAAIGGSEELALSEQDGLVTLENAKVRLVLSAASGAVRELANKETGVYLIRGSENDIPLMLEFQDGRFSFGFETCGYTVSQTDDEIAVRFEWTYPRDLKAASTISLKEDSDEAEFTLDLFNNRLEDSVLDVEYPYLADVGRLYSEETDKLFHTYASGYVFDDPVSNFNRDDFKGIRWYMGLYPYGFGSTMQFMSYYVEGYGGFHIQTYDRGYTVKSFTVTGTGKSLHMGVRHYLDDLSSGDKSFYKIGISNLTEGRWEESCERYREFALTCPWTEKAGLLADKTAENETLRSFYEDTTLVNFAPHVGYAANAWTEWPEIYRRLSSNAGGGKIFNIVGNDWQRIHTAESMNGEWDTMFPAVINETFYDQMKEKDFTAFFEFNNMFNVNGADDRGLRVSQATKDRLGNPQTLQDSVNPAIAWWYMCPSEDWYEFSKRKTDAFLGEYDADFLYHDCGYCVAPRTCFDFSHAHGTRVNIIPDEIAFLDRLTAESGTIVGEELISEVFVGTVGYYQARANAGGMGFMDNNDIRVPVENNLLEKVPAFDYLYHPNGILRTDGFMKPLREAGDMFYSVMGYTALTGGVPQLNYEYLKASFNASELVPEMLAYLNELGALKTGAGKNYLTYGQMLPAPKTGAGTIEYNYLNTSVVGDIPSRGTARVNKVVTSAWRYGESTAVMLSNVTAEPVEVRFVLQAGRDYGIMSGTVWLGGKKIGAVKNGKAKISLTLSPRKADMLEIKP